MFRYYGTVLFSVLFSKKVILQISWLPLDFHELFQYLFLISRCIVWCKQLMLSLNRALFDMIGTEREDDLN